MTDDNKPDSKLTKRVIRVSSKIGKLNIKSGYIKRQIKNLEYTEENRKYVESLIWLERRILKNVSSLSHIIFYKGLEDKYKFEFETLFKELDYQGYQKYLIEQQMLNEHVDRWQNESKSTNL